MSEVADACITCGDVAVAVTVVEALDGERARCVAPDGGTELVATDLVGPVAAGHELLVHACVAIAVLAGNSP